MRRKAKTQQTTDPEPLVLDPQGLPVGLRVAVAPAEDDSRQARRLRRLEALRRTRELDDGQHRMRRAFSLFSSDPPR